MTLMIQVGLALSKRLKASRLLADMEQADLARELGVARSTVSMWERGHTEPSATHFVRWAQITGQSLDWFAEAVNAERPAEAGRSENVRPEGFEPPAY